MSRTLADMSEPEQREYRTHSARLDSPMTTEQERIESRTRLDELEWKGPSASFNKSLAAFDKRLSALEQSDGGSVDAADIIAQAVEAATQAATIAAAEAVGEMLGTPETKPDGPPPDEVF